MSNFREVTENLPEKINVLEYGGVVGGTYKSQQQIESKQYLTGQAFLSRSCLPDVKPNTKIIGICGITDSNGSNDPLKPGRADPQNDGWFFSDFYLCHHLFKLAAKDQIWMTCVKPEDAVKKYTEYVHGNYYSEEAGSRRVVLDRTMLNEVTDIRVVPPELLLERVAATIRQACCEATAEGRPVLILIFSHGEEDTFAIEMGGKHRNSNYLTIDTFKQAIGSRAPKAGLCLVTTACYSGGWAITPTLNITTLTSQAAWLQSLAWPISGTIRRRSCGSPFVSALTGTLLKLTMEGYNAENTDDYYSSPTYAGLTKLVRDAVHNIDPKKTTASSGTSFMCHNPMFLAQDDEWEMEFSKRTGFPLNMFRDRWLQLKAAGARQEPPGGEHQFGPGERIFSRDQLLAAVKREGSNYLASRPGLDEYARNLALHNTIHRLLDGIGAFDIDDLVEIRETIDYRMNQVMGTATTYKNFWNLNIPDCHQVDVEAYANRGHQSYEAIFSLVCKYPLFDKPTYLQGHRYIKGARYITCCILEAGWTPPEAIAKLDSLVKYRAPSVPGSGVPTIPGASRIMATINKHELNRDRTIRDKVSDIAKSTKRKLRSLSPRKSRRMTLPQGWTQEDITTGVGSLGLSEGGLSR